MSLLKGNEYWNAVEVVQQFITMYVISVMAPENKEFELVVRRQGKRGPSVQY